MIVHHEVLFPGEPSGGTPIKRRNAGMAGMRVFPALDVESKTGRIVDFGCDAFAMPDTLLAPGGAVRRMAFSDSLRGYVLENHAIEIVLPYEVVREFDLAAPLMPDALKERAKTLVMRALSLNLETAQAALALNPENHAPGHVAVPARKWTEPASDPLADIDAGIEAIRKAIGIVPNGLLLSWSAYKELKRHPALAPAAPVIPALLADHFDLERVIVGAPRRWPAADAASETEAGSFDIWGAAALLFYSPEQPSGIDEPAFGYTYALAGHPRLDAAYRDRWIKSLIVGASYMRAPYIVCPAAGYLILDAV